MLDGDIDPMWIESLNTVMDDNKILTLASNERIPLLPEMKLVFETSWLEEDLADPQPEGEGPAGS